MNEFKQIYQRQSNKKHCLLIADPVCNMDNYEDYGTSLSLELTDKEYVNILIGLINYGIKKREIKILMKKYGVLR